jgi:hypothetical protein
VRRTIGEDFQARAPLVSRDRKVWTKTEIKEEEELAEKALKELYLEDKMAAYDKKLFSEKDYMPVQVEIPLKEINKIKKELSNEANIVDQEFLEALQSGNSDQIFLFQMSDLPIVPQFGKQEPASDEKIAEFVKKYNFQGELFQKIEVNGRNAHRKRRAENVCFFKSNFVISKCVLTKIN